MKKLKIFLLLSILLCFGFMLSFEVHAQGDGPKHFEVNDILPATTQLKISWENHTFIGDGYHFIRLNNSAFIRVLNNNITILLPGQDPLNFDDEDMFCIIDISSYSETERTITSVDSYFSDFTYEDIEPKAFEVNDILPATTQLRISWNDDISHIYIDGGIYSKNGSFTLIETSISGNIYINNTMIFVGGITNDFIPPYTNYDGNHPYIDIDTST